MSVYLYVQLCSSVYVYVYLAGPYTITRCLRRRLLSLASLWLHSQLNRLCGHRGLGVL